MGTTTEELLDTEAAMDMLGMKRNTFFKWRKLGLLVPTNDTGWVERPKKLEFRRADLEALKQKSPAELRALLAAAQERQSA